MHTHLAEKTFDEDHAIEIADRVWWVGHHIPGEMFQCHAYLIEHGDQSVLIDPGSVLTFDNTLKKIEEVTAFSNIRYFICHNQDHDITASLSRIDSMVSRSDAVIVTHWRAEALLKHYGLKLPMWRVEDNDWTLELGGRKLEFVFTPYLHSPGAFCTFDTTSDILFSSDLFGGFTEEAALYAEDESYFESMRPFHEHYMPSKDIFQHALINIEKKPLRMIAPQHGRIIPEKLVGFMIEKLKGLECGLPLMVKKDSDISRLTGQSNMIRGFMNALLTYRDFSDIAKYLFGVSKEILPVKSLEFYVERKAEKELICFSLENNYHGEALPGISYIASVIKSLLETPVSNGRMACERLIVEDGDEPRSVLAIPLDIEGISRASAVAFFTLCGEEDIGAEVTDFIELMSTPLSVAIEREVMYQMLETERNTIYEDSMRDPLTGLYTRYYMNDSVQRLINSHDRGDSQGVALVMMDVDHFKSVNDNFGDTVGDDVLRIVGKVILEELRKVDIPIRYGGEEFALFLPVHDIYTVSMVAERIRKVIGAQVFTAGDKEFSITMSAGVAIHTQNESLKEFLTRTDKALYSAKKSGRNRYCRAT